LLLHVSAFASSNAPALPFLKQVAEWREEDNALQIEICALGVTAT
jgi:hypothetical protein